MRRSRLTVMVLSGALALGACGGGDDDGDDALTPQEQQELADAAIAAFEERLTDAGFTRSEDQGDDSDDLEFESAECQEYDAAFTDDELPNETARADSDDFELGVLSQPTDQQETVVGSVGYSERSDDLEEYFELLRNDRLIGCLEEALETAGSGEEAVEIADLDVRQLSSADLGTAGDEQAGVSIGGVFVSTEVPDLRFPFTFDFRFARAGNRAAMVMAATIGPGEPSSDPDALLQQLVEGSAEGA